jgi:hypothetical protein
MVSNTVEVHNPLVSLKKNFTAETSEYIFTPGRKINLEFITEQSTLLKDAAEYTNIAYADKVFIEKYKLKLMKSLIKLINIQPANTDVSPIVITTREESSPPYLKYYFYLLSGLVVNLVHGFLGSRALLSLIPNITNPVLTVFNGLMTLLNGFAYYLYEGYVLKKNLNIPIMDASTQEYLSIFEDQLEYMNKINEKILSANFVNYLSKTQYTDLTKAAARLNELLMMNRYLFSNYAESKRSYIFRQSIIVFGGIMAAGSAFFAINSFMTSFATVLLGTLTGNVLALGFVALGVGFYIGQRTHKVYKMMNPAAYKFKEIQQQFDSFKPRFDGDFNLIIRRIPEIKPTVANDTVSKRVKFAASRQTHRLFKDKRPAPLQEPQSCPIPSDFLQLTPLQL